MIRRLLVGLPLAAIAAVILVLFLILWGQNQTPRNSVDIVVSVSPLIGQPLPEWTFATLQDEESYSTSTFSSMARGQTPDAPPEERFLLVNFWASWCQPCVAEHPLLMQFHQASMATVGILFKDSDANGIQFIERRGNPFDIVLKDPEGEGALQFGVAGVPETYLIDGHGVIREHLRGELTIETINARIMPILRAER